MILNVISEILSIVFNIIFFTPNVVRFWYIVHFILVDMEWVFVVGQIHTANDNLRTKLLQLFSGKVRGANILLFAPFFQLIFLAIFICEYEQNGEERYVLYNFFADKKHCENIVKNDKRLFSDEIVNIELNLYYKSAQTLLNILVKNGYKVSCYYEEAKEKTQ